jgi:MFS family permease
MTGEGGADVAAVEQRRDPGVPSEVSPGSRAALVAALGAVFVGALDLTVIATILPRMVFDLDINTADIDRYVWIVNGYLLAYLVAIPITGRLSDLIGRPLAFQLSLAVFLLGSLWCAVADDLPSLIVGRAIQGAGGGALLPVTMALVGDLLPPRRRVAALGLVGAVDTLGWVLGPLWGAALVALFDDRSEPWRWVFYVNLPLGLAAAAAIAATSRNLSRQPSAVSPRASRLAPRSSRLTVRRLDVVGAALLATSLLLLNLALSSGGELGGSGGEGLRALGGTPNPLGDYLWPLLIGSFVVGALFLWWERRVSLPIIPLGLFHGRRFSAAIAANFLAGAALIVGMVNVPVAVALLVDSDRVSNLSALMLAPFTLLMAALSFVGGIVVGRFGERGTAAAGLVLVALGYAALWYGLRDEELSGMVPGLIVAGAGFGLVVAPIGASVIESAPAADRGIAAALSLVFRLLGMTIGISTLTALGVRRLQVLTGRLETPVPLPDESTAAFLLRQQQFVQDHAIPLAVQVIRETFLAAGVIALVALVPVAYLGARREARGAR